MARGDTSLASAQARSGWNYDEGPLETADGHVLTLTFEHTLDWMWGDSYLFVDALSGQFVSGTQYSLYFEWQPRFSLSRISGASFAWGPFGDLLVAGSFNRGPGYDALLAGLGTNFAIELPMFWLLNVYLRDDNFNAPTYQLTTAWTIPYTLGADWVLNGFADVYGTDVRGVNVLTEPQLLLDTTRWLGLKAGRLQLGGDLLLHLEQDFTVVVPQTVVKWLY